MPRRSLVTREKDYSTGLFKKRWCPKCADYKEREEFHPDAGKPGITTYCHDCTARREELAATRRAEYLAERARVDERKKERHLEKISRIQGQYEKSQKRSEKREEFRLQDYARRRAELYNVPFSLTVDDIVIPAKCPVFGFPLVRNTGIDAKAKFNSPTIDRIIPGKGYVKGNIHVISGMANTIKGNRDLAEWKMFAKWILTL